MKAKDIARTAFIITGLTLVPGLVFFAGSIHSGGPAFFASMYIVPPLYLDYRGFIPVNGFMLFVATIALLQFLLVLFLVVIYTWLKQKIGGISEKRPEST